MENTFVPEIGINTVAFSLEIRNPELLALPDERLFFT